MSSARQACRRRVFGPVVSGAVIPLTSVDLQARMSQPLGSRLVQDALLFPTMRRADTPDRLLMGVFDAAGDLVPDSLLSRRAGERAAPIPAEDFDVDERAMTVPEAIYCGPLYNHFGHFLLESLARVWYARQHPDVLLVWAGAKTWARDVGLKAWQHEILQILGVTNPTWVATNPAPVERLHMPDIGYRYDDWFHPQHAEFLASYHGPPQDDSVKVWLSRSRLAKDVRDLNAATVERRLAAAGWTIVFPEQLTVHEQLDHVARASTLAGEEGSAFHLLMLLDEVRDKTLHVMRRLGGEHRNMRTIGDARGITQHFHSLRNEVVIKATGRYVTKVSANASEVLDILDVPVPEPPVDTADAEAAAIVSRVAGDFAASSYLEIGAGRSTAVPLLHLPRMAAVCDQFSFDPRAYRGENISLFELPFEQYLASFADPGQYDIIRVTAPTARSGIRTIVGSQALSHRSTLWLVDVPADPAEAERLLVDIHDLLPSLVVRVFEHGGVPRALARRDVLAFSLAAEAERTTGRTPAPETHVGLAPPGSDGLDTALQAFSPEFFPQRGKRTDPAVQALVEDNRALRRKIRRLRAERQQRERTPRERVRGLLQKARRSAS